MRFACQMGMCDYRFHQEETGEAPPTFPLEPWRWCHPEMFGKCWENVRHWRRPLPCLSPGLCFQQNVRKMFGIGRCPCPLGGSPLPHPSPQIFGNVGKCSENVRKMFGTGVAGPRWEVGGAAAPIPNIFRTFSKHFRRFAGAGYRPDGEAPTNSKHFPQISGWHTLQGEGWGSGQASSKHFRTFPNLSEPCRGGGGAGGRPPKGERHPTILNMFQTFSEHFCRNRHPGEWGVEVMERPLLPTRPHPGGISNMFHQRGHPPAAATDHPNRSLPRFGPVG